MKFIAPAINCTNNFWSKRFGLMIAVLILAFGVNAQTAFVQQSKLTATDAAAQDALGFSVAISGDTAIVGAPRNTGGSGLQQRGSAYVYVRNSAGAWTFQQKLAPSDGAATDQFGYSVAINGSTIAVGRYNTTTGQNRADGKVYIFTRTGTTWTETQTIQSSDIAQGDSFGYSLAFENDTLAVGARNKVQGTNFFQGAAYIFTRSASGGNFTQQAKLLASDGQASDFFGEAVALSGETAIIGSVNDFGQTTAVGQAYIFVRSGSTWTEQQIIRAPDNLPATFFGTSVSISGETAVIGARAETVNNVGAQGAAYVFTRNGGSWTLQQKLLGVEPTQRNDNFGYSVAVKGDTIAVGSPAHEFVSSIANHGAVYIFSRSGSTWTRTDKLLHNDPAPDALGQAVAFDGNSILAGAPSKDSTRGAAYVFNGRSISGQSRLISGVDLVTGAGYGTSVAISSDTALVGSLNWGRLLYTRSGNGWQFVRKLSVAAASNSNTWFSNGGATIVGDQMFVGAPGAVVNNVNAAGAIYIFNRVNGNWVEGERIDAPESTALQAFGNTVVISGDTLVVSAPNKTVGANQNQGAVYVFVRNSSNWTFQQKLTASDGAAQDSFGRSLAISGDTIIAGAAGVDVNGAINRGAAYVFTRSGSTWTQQPRILASDGNANDNFGSTVALEGDTAVIGAPSREIGENFTAGTAYVYTRSGLNWNETQILNESDSGNNFAGSVAISGDSLIIGQPGFQDTAENLFNAGAVYVYRRSGTNWTKRGRLLAFDSQTSSGFGESVGISGNMIISGAPGKDIYGLTNAGVAYIFDLNQISFASPGADFDGDGKADLGVFRASNSGWYIQRSSAGFAGVQFGISTDKIVPADFDGDGKTDVAVWRESEGVFYILNSSNNSVRVESFGLSGDNPATVGDWDGDGKSDLSVYRNGSGGGQSYFFYRGSNNNPNGNITYLPFGTTGDKPVRGDFDGDGKLDTAVFRPSNGIWYVRNSSDGAIRYENWGISTDKLVPADFDGDGKTDIAVFRDGNWYIKQSSNNQPRYETFGTASDQPTAADFDGDGKADVAVFRNGVWYIKQSSSANISYQTFGASGDTAIQSAFVQ